MCQGTPLGSCCTLLGHVHACCAPQHRTLNQGWVQAHARVRLAEHCAAKLQQLRMWACLCMCASLDQRITCSMCSFLQARFCQRTYMPHLWRSLKLFPCMRMFMPL